MYGLSGLGQGFIQGMQTRRQHNREDERDEMHREQFGLQMRQGEQSLRHADELHDPRLEGMQLGNQRTQQQLDFDTEANPLRISGLELGNQRTQQAMRHADSGERRAQQMHGFNVRESQDAQWARDMSMNYQTATRFLANGRIPEFQEVFNRFLPPENQIEAMAETEDGRFLIRYGAGDEEELSIGEIGERLRIMGQPDTWMEETFGPQEAGGAGGAGGMGMPGGIDSTEARRVMDAVRNRVDRVFQTHLGAEFIGNPENASLHSAASQVAADVSTMLYSNGIPFVPDSIGAFSADLALGGRILGLREQEAMDMAQEGLSRRERRDTETVQARAREIQQEAQRQLYQAVFERAVGQAQQGGMREGEVTVGEPTAIPPGADGSPQPLSGMGMNAPETQRAPGLQVPDSPPELPERAFQPDEGLMSGLRAGESVRGAVAGLRGQHLPRDPQREAMSIDPNFQPGLPQRSPSGSPLPMVGGFFSGLFGDSSMRDVPRGVQNFAQAMQEGRAPSAQDMAAAERYFTRNERARKSLSPEEKQALIYWLDKKERGNLND